MNADVLLAYAAAMREAQRLERRLKQIAAIHRVVIAGVRRAKGSDDSSRSGDEVELAFHAVKGKSLGQLVRTYIKDLAEFSGSQPKFDDLEAVAELRNFLAHHFFERRDYCDGRRPFPKLISEIPGRHDFNEDYLDYIEEPHPDAMAELRAALSCFQDHIREVEAWISKVLSAMRESDDVDFD